MPARLARQLGQEPFRTRQHPIESSARAQIRGLGDARAQQSRFLRGRPFFSFGCLFLILVRDYELGSARRMGPGYSPAVLSLLLIGIGLLTMSRAFLVRGPPLGGIAGRGLALVSLAVALFALIVEGAGLAIATIVLVVVSGVAGPRFHPLALLLLALALSDFAVLAFVTGLGLPVPALGVWVRG